MDAIACRAASRQARSWPWSGSASRSPMTPAAVPTDPSEDAAWSDRSWSAPATARSSAGAAAAVRQPPSARAAARARLPWSRRAPAPPARPGRPRDVRGPRDNTTIVRSLLRRREPAKMRSNSSSPSALPTAASARAAPASVLSSFRAIRHSVSRLLSPDANAAVSRSSSSGSSSAARSAARVAGWSGRSARSTRRVAGAPRRAGPTARSPPADPPRSWAPRRRSASASISSRRSASTLGTRLPLRHCSRRRSTALRRAIPRPVLPRSMASEEMRSANSACKRRRVSASITAMTGTESRKRAACRRTRRPPWRCRSPGARPDRCITCRCCCRPCTTRRAVAPCAHDGSARRTPNGPRLAVKLGAADRRAS